MIGLNSIHRNRARCRCAPFDAYGDISEPFENFLDVHCAYHAALIWTFPDCLALLVTPAAYIGIIVRNAGRPPRKPVNRKRHFGRLTEPCPLTDGIGNIGGNSAGDRCEHPGEIIQLQQSTTNVINEAIHRLNTMTVLNSGCFIIKSIPLEEFMWDEYYSVTTIDEVLQLLAERGRMLGSSPEERV
jgi:hypothetical protein